MAQVVDYYRATATATWYIFNGPGSDASSIYQFQKNETILLPADYASRGENGRYPVTSPRSGWVNWTYLGNITAVYKTVTDPCTAPTSVTLNTSTKVLTISGGAGGDLNTFTGYGVSYRERSIGGTWGGWSGDTVVSGSSTTLTLSVTVPAGKERQFRARTLGSAGSSYYSAYVECATIITGNSAPRDPVIRRPAANAETLNPSPCIIVECSSDPDGDSMTLYRRIDSGSWAAIKTTTGATVYDQLPVLSAGSHTVSYKLNDAYAESAAVSRTFTVHAHTWGRTINAGDVIANVNISHRAEISEMLSAINVQRTFYGLSAIALSGTVGRFGDWKAQMEKLLSGINDCRNAMNMSSVSLTVPSVPTAFVINTIRSLTTGTAEGGSGTDSAVLDQAVLDQMKLA